MPAGQPLREIKDSPSRSPLDGSYSRRVVAEAGAVFEAKFMLPWSFSEEGAT